MRNWNFNIHSIIKVIATYVSTYRFSSGTELLLLKKPWTELFQLFPFNFSRCLSLNVYEQTWNSHCDSAAAPPLYTNTHFFLCGVLKKVEVKQAARQTWFSQRLEFPPGPRGLWHITNRAQRLMASVSSDDATTGLVGQEAHLIRCRAKTNFRTHTVSSLRQWRRKKKKVEGGRGSYAV